MSSAQAEVYGAPSIHFSLALYGAATAHTPSMMSTTTATSTTAASSSSPDEGKKDFPATNSSSLKKSSTVNSNSTKRSSSRRRKVPTDAEAKRKYFMNRLHKVSQHHMEEQFTPSVVSTSSAFTSSIVSKTKSDKNDDAKGATPRSIGTTPSEKSTPEESSNNETAVEGSSRNLSSLDMSLRGLNFVEDGDDDNNDDMTELVLSPTTTTENKKKTKNSGLPYMCSNSIFSNIIQSMTACGAASHLKHEDEEEKISADKVVVKKAREGLRINKRSYNRSGEVDVLKFDGRPERVHYEKGGIMNREVSFPRSVGSLSSYSTLGTKQSSFQQQQQRQKQAIAPSEPPSSAKPQTESPSKLLTYSDNEKNVVISTTTTAIGTITATPAASSNAKSTSGTMTKVASPRSSPINASGRPPLCPSPPTRRRSNSSSHNTPPRRPLSPNSPQSPPRSPQRGGDNILTASNSPPPPPPPPRTSDDSSAKTPPRTPPRKKIILSSSSSHVSSKDAPVIVTPPSPLRRQNANQKENEGTSQSALSRSLWTDNSSPASKTRQSNLSQSLETESTSFTGELDLEGSSTYSSDSDDEDSLDGVFAALEVQNIATSEKDRNKNSRSKFFDPKTRPGQEPRSPGTPPNRKEDDIDFIFPEPSFDPALTFDSSTDEEETLGTATTHSITYDIELIKKEAKRRGLTMEDLLMEVESTYSGGRN